MAWVAGMVGVRFLAMALVSVSVVPLVEAAEPMEPAAPAAYDTFFRVQREQASRAAQARRSPALGVLVDTRAARVGPLHVNQTWTLRVEFTDASMARKTSHAGQLTPGVGAPTIFRFRVNEVDDGSAGRARISVTRDGANIASLVVDANRQLVSISILRPGSIGLDYFPLRIPLSGASIEDALGRPIKIEWQEGDPWPSFMTGPAGTAVLVEEGP